MDAAVTRAGLMDIQVCVPASWNDDQVLAFANWQHPCGTTNGWLIRRQGDPALVGTNERTQCGSLPDHVHIMLDA